MTKQLIPTVPPAAGGVERPSPSLADLRAWINLLWARAKNLIKRPFYSLYLHRLREEAHTWTLPRHIGIVMDGNRRFARNYGFQSAIEGHTRGAEKLHEVLDWCYDLGIPTVTVWCFSLDNFQRSAAEVEALFRLFETKTREIGRDREVHDNKIRVRYIGQIELLPESLQKEIREVEEATSGYDQYVLNIAMAYGGREEIIEAVRRYLEARRDEGESVEEIVDGLESAAIEPYLYTSGQPEPDLIIRTSGEVRLSGFLLWQSAYSEYYFCDTFWPAFREIDLLRAVRSFDQRQRRYGR
jgi:short-chain Z-isoprenyl diphosphate synthase